MSDIPKSIVLFGIKFKILLVDLTEEDLHGDCNFNKKTIRIHSGDSAEDQSFTLLHECMHMLFEISGMDEILGSKKEEAIIRCLENGLRDKVELIWQ